MTQFHSIFLEMETNTGLFSTTCPLTTPSSGKTMQIFGKVGLKIGLVGEVNSDENF